MALFLKILTKVLFLNTVHRHFPDYTYSCQLLLKHMPKSWIIFSPKSLNIVKKKPFILSYIRWSQTYIEKKFYCWINTEFCKHMIEVTRCCVTNITDRWTMMWALVAVVLEGEQQQEGHHKTKQSHSFR